MNAIFYLFVCVTIALSLLVMAFATIAGVIYFSNHFEKVRRSHKHSVQPLVLHHN